MTDFNIDINLFTFIISLLIGYASGSIPFGLIFTKLNGYGDIRTVGSGNIGATNVLRAGNKKIAALTLLSDGMKGYVPAIICYYLWNEQAMMLAGIASIIGHIFPIWLNFKGGKGVATYIGVLFAVGIIVGLVFCLCWLITALILKYSSVSALISTLLTPIYMITFDYRLQLAVFCVTLALVIFYTHRTNIQRLYRKEEPKIKLRK